MTTTRYLWNPINQNIIREYDDVGNTVASYTTEPDLYGDVVSQHRDGQDSVYHYDGQGSTLALTNANGNITDTYAYSAFGTVTAYLGSTTNPYQYIGRQGYYDNAEAGGFEVRRSIYEASEGRWLSLLPLRATTPSYHHAENAPLTVVDLFSTTVMVFWFKTAKTKLSIVHGDSLLSPKARCGSTPFQQWDFFIDFTDFSGRHTGAPCDGFIVQKVKWNCGILSCDPDNPVSICMDGGEYYEAWFVQKDQRRSSLSKKRNGTDTAEATPPVPSKGACSQKGEIRFYCKDAKDDFRGVDETDVTGDLRTKWKPGRFGVPPCDITSGVLPATDDPPKFWKNKVPIAGPVDRQFAVLWCCCGFKGGDKFKAYATPETDAEDKDAVRETIWSKLIN